MAVFVAFKPKVPDDVGDCGEKLLEDVCFTFRVGGQFLFLLLLRDFLGSHTFDVHVMDFLESFVFLCEFLLVYSPVSREFALNQIIPSDFSLVCLQLVVRFQAWGLVWGLFFAFEIFQEAVFE